MTAAKKTAIVIWIASGHLAAAFVVERLTGVGGVFWATLAGYWLLVGGVLLGRWFERSDGGP